MFNKTKNYLKKKAKNVMSWTFKGNGTYALGGLWCSNGAELGR